MKYAVSIAVGTFVALLLFLMMHALISGTSGFQKQNEDIGNLEFVRVRADELLNVKERRLWPMQRIPGS